MTHHDPTEKARQRAEHLAHSAIDDAKVRLKKLREEARARGEAFIDEVRDRGEDFLKEAQGRGRTAARSAGEWVGENPLQAVGIAFLAGMAVAGLIRSRGED